jgi:hypothetical protein
VRIATLRRPVAWDGSGLSVRDESTGSVEVLDDVATLVMAAPDVAGDALGALRSDGVTVEAIGDCVAPRTALVAIYQGHELAMNL